MAGPVSQSNTEWVRAGQMVNGKAVEKGYLAQKGKPEKRVTAKVKLSTTVGEGGKTIKNVRGISDYFKGRNVTGRAAGAKQTNPSSPKKPIVSPSSTPNPGAVNTVSNQSLKTKVPPSTPNGGGVNTVSNQSKIPDKKRAANVNRSGMVSVGNELTGASNYGKRMNTQYSQDRLTPKKPGAAPKPSTRPKIAMPTGKQVSKATGGVMGMSAAGTPIRKQMPAGAQTDLVKLGAKTLLTPGVGLAAGAIKGGTTAGRIIASKVAGSAAGKAVGRSAVTAGAKAAGKVAGTKTVGKVAKSAVGKAVGKKVATNKAAAVKVANRQFIDNSNAASRAASRADSIARTKAALNRAGSATNKRNRASALAAARREKPKYGKGR